MAKLTNPKKQSNQVFCVAQFLIPVADITTVYTRKIICGVTDALLFICEANTVRM